MKSSGNTNPKLLLLGNATQVHLRRWAEYFQDNGYEVLTLSLEKTEDFPTPCKNARMPGFLPGFIRYPLA
ncbi:MAG: hypothetical protein ABIA59_08665, partial [Candidatus Latescibacterota bacterium]